MANTYSLISSVAVDSSGTSTISFTSIPQNYTDLVIMFSNKSDRAASTEAIMLTINGNTSNGSWRELFGNVANGGAGSQSASSAMRVGYGGTSNTGDTSLFGNTFIYFPNYTSSANKSVISDSITERGSDDAYVAFESVSWANTAAITSISLAPLLGTKWVQHTNAYLYGISNS